jgi:hypothetical protein
MLGSVLGMAVGMILYKQDEGWGFLPYKFLPCYKFPALLAKRLRGSFLIYTIISI